MSNELSLEGLAHEALSEMVRLLGIEAVVSSGELEDKRLKMCLDSDNAGRLIGRKGQSLESLELLLNRILKCANEEIRGYRRGTATRPAEPAAKLRRRGERADSEKPNAYNDSAKEGSAGKKKRLQPLRRLDWLYT